MAKKAEPTKNYIFAVGRRKTAVAKVKLLPDGSGKIVINTKPYLEYFPTIALQKKTLAVLELFGLEKKIDAQILLSGGGKSAQADAAGLGLARALVKNNPDIRTVLKKQKMLTRNARKKERKKPGLKRARRAPQWQKR